MDSASPLNKKAKLSESPKAPTGPEMKSHSTVPLARKALDLTTPAQPCDTGFPAGGPPQWFSAFFADFEKRLDLRMQSLLDAKLSSLQNKVGEQGDRLKNVEFDTKDLHDKVKKLEKENEELINKLDDIENRSRRNNLVIFGIPEGKEGKKEDCADIMKEFFLFAGVHADDVAQMERVHRTPTYLPQKSTKSIGQEGSATSSPRRIHVSFNSYNAKERVRKACIEKLKATKSYKGKKVFVAEDLSKRVLRLRKEKSPRLRKLKDEGKRPFFAYPARLFYRDKDGKLISVE